MCSGLIDITGSRWASKKCRSLTTLVPHGLTLPLQNITEKQIMVFNTLVYSDKELQSGFSKKAWPFF